MKALGIVFIFILLSLLFIGGPGYQDGRLLKELWETGHFVLFSSLTFFMLQAPIFQQRHWLSLFFISGIFSIVFGLSTELLQLLVGRTFSLKDLGNDVIGGYAGFTAAQLYLKIKQSSAVTIKLYSLFSIIILTLSITGARGFILVAMDETKMRISFPQLADFEELSEISRWSTFFAKISISQKYTTKGNNSLKFTLIPHRYSDITLDSFVGNWQGFNRIAFNLYNPQKQPIKMVVKIFDQQHHHNRYHFSDRFNQDISVNPGWNKFEFSISDIINAPADRIMDIKNIDRISLFTIDIKKKMTFYLDDLRLVKISQ